MGVVMMEADEVPDLPFFHDLVYEGLTNKVINYSTSMTPVMEAALVSAGVNPEEFGDE